MVQGFLLGLREGRGWERDELAEKTGFSVETIRQHEDGSRMPTFHERRLYALAYALEGGTLALEDAWRGMGVDVLPAAPDATRVPVINRCPAGEALDFDECFRTSGVAHEYIDRPPGVEGVHLAAFIIMGDSMEPDYPDGWFAIFRREDPTEVPDGAACFVRLGAAHNYACTFKRAWRVSPTEVDLRPDNPAYEPMRVLKENIIVAYPVVAVIRRDATQPARAAEKYERRVEPDEYCQPFPDYDS